VVAGSAIHGHTLNRQINRKAPTSPHTTRPGGADREGHPGRVKAKWGGSRAEERMGTGITFIVGTLFHIPDSPDPGNMNQQG